MTQSDNWLSRPRISARSAFFWSVIVVLYDRLWQGYAALPANAWLQNTWWQLAAMVGIPLLAAIDAVVESKYLRRRRAREITSS
jgi:hypothetical protein